MPTPTTDDVLKRIAYHLETLAISVLALETVAMSDKYAGKRITDAQLSDLKQLCKGDLKEVFAELHGMIAARSTN